MSKALFTNRDFVAETVRHATIESTARNLCCDLYDTMLKLIRAPGLIATVALVTIGSISEFGNPQILRWILVGLGFIIALMRGFEGLMTLESTVSKFRGEMQVLEEFIGRWCTRAHLDVTDRHIMTLERDWRSVRRHLTKVPPRYLQLASELHDAGHAWIDDLQRRRSLSHSSHEKHEIHEQHDGKEDGRRQAEHKLHTQAAQQTHAEHKEAAAPTRTMGNILNTMLAPLTTAMSTPLSTPLVSTPLSMVSPSAMHIDVHQ